VTLQILGDGALRGITVDANAAGEARGFVSGRDAAAPRDPWPGPRRRARLAALVGAGVVNVIRDLGLRERYQGASALASGEIDEDVEHHLTVSEQVESALRCDAVLDERGGVRAAGGVLVQCLPGGDVAAVARARARLAEGLFAALAGGPGGAVELATRALGAGVDVLDVRPVRFRCPCSRDRVCAALALCGEEELRAMLRDDGGAEVTCNFCAQPYRVDAGELGRLIDSLPRA
jgi:molecular chaperone Hsp33